MCKYGGSDGNVPSTTEEKLQIKELKGLSKEESRSWLEYAAKSGLLRRRVDEALVSEMWALSGGGRVEELVKVGMRVGNV